MQAAGRRPVGLAGGGVEVGAEPRRDRREAHLAAGAADEITRQQMLVAGAHDHEVGPQCQELPAVRLVGGNLPAAVLDAEHTGLRREAGQCRGIVGHGARTDRRAIEQERQGRRFQHMPLVDQRRFRIMRQREGIGREDEQEVRAGGLSQPRILRQHEARLGVDPGADDAALRRNLAGDGDDPALLLRGEHEILAGMSVDEKPVNAGRAGDLGDVGGERRLVDAEIRRHRHDGRGMHAGEALRIEARHAALAGCGRSLSMGKSGSAGSRSRMRSASSFAM